MNDSFSKWDWKIAMNNQMGNVQCCLDETFDFLQTYPEQLEELNQNQYILRSLSDLLPETLEKFCSGHNFAIVETEIEMETSIHFALMGYYKQAIYVLRNVLELGCLSVYWDIDDKSHLNIKEWIREKENTPFKKKIFSQLLTLSNIAKYEDEMNFIGEIDVLYGELCDFSHTKGYGHSFRSLSMSNVNRFNEKSFLLWLKYMKKVLKIVATVHILKYPVALQYTPMDEKFGLNGPAGGFLSPFQSERLLDLYDKSEQELLQRISSEDENAMSLAEWVNGQSDITESQLEEQIINHDKWEVEMMGYEKWERNQKSLIISLKDSPAAMQKMKDRMAIIKKWYEGKGMPET